MKKIKQLGDILPIYKIEHDYILSKQGDLTLAFKVELPEIFTLGLNEFEALHQTWNKAIRLLPKYTIIHKQDWFTGASFKGDFSNSEISFLSKSSERHFHERPYLDHRCFLFLTKKPDARHFTNSLFSNLIKPSIAPLQTIDEKYLESFEDKVAQFVNVLQNSGFITLRRLKSEELASLENKAGLLEQYCFLLQENETPVIRDLIITTDSIKIGNYYCNLFTLADVSDLPPLCGPRIDYDRYSTDKTKFSISFTTPVAQLLNCNHIYNQFIVLDDSAITLKKLESRRLRLQALSSYSRENAISRDAVNKFLNEAISQQRLPVKAHFNLFTWSEDREQSKDIRNMVSAAAAQMNACARQETTGAAQIYWACMPGNAGAIPLNETFDTFCEIATCFLNMETNYRTSIAPTGLRLADRNNGVPVYVDLSDEPMSRGIITNRSKFILGPSGTGKSFFTNLYLRSYVEQGAHAVIIDIGHSYKGLCDLFDGYYFTYSEKEPIQFNPFVITDEEFNIEKKESIKTLLLTLWKKDNESFSRSEYVTLSNSLVAYYSFLNENPGIFPCFNSFYDFVKDIFVSNLRAEGIKEKDFDIDNFLYVLKPFYLNGEYDFLLNAKKNIDLLNQPFVVFELDSIRDNILLPTITVIIMDTVINKMRKLKGVRKIVLIEEAWKSIMKQGMAEYVRYLFKTMRKHFGEPIVVTQEVDDIISSPIVKDAIISNSDCKILLDQAKYMNKFQGIQELLSLTEKERTLILSMNKANDPRHKYKEVFISLGTISKVYRTEVSLEEYLCYTTEEKEKLQVQNYARKYGSIKKGIAMLANDIRNNTL